MRKGTVSMPTGYRPEFIQSAFIDFISTRLHPFWSLTTPKLRLVAKHTLSDDLVALQFEINNAFKQQSDGWQGGAHINLSIAIDGILHQRSYSLVGLPHQTLWWTNGNSRDKKLQRQTLTIAIKPQGLVSNYLINQAALSTIFDSSIPSGDFTLEQISVNQQINSVIKNTEIKNSVIKELAPILCIAGGSGITPMLGLVKQALQHGHKVTLVHYNRTSLSSSPLQEYWQQLATTYPSFTYYLINTEDASTYLTSTRHLSAASLLALNLPLADTQIFACGSQALLKGLYHAASEINLPNNHSLRDNIIIENFGYAVPDLNLSDATEKIDNLEKHTVYLRARQRQFDSSGTLLVDAEQAGLRMNYGCRQGICQMCRCNKVSGVVKNIQTGKISGDGFESIQTCINVAMTDVVLDI
ncbi:iron-sulfur cluster-binding domain-containing protein [Psychrobacter sp. P11G5]|uniref:flavin reductase family protein n=1 Tax=Psychrobacter sp. P11G5 TaxID=1699624 RepID=UPI001D0D0429|nr:iron-sulfur cluster-binding domain-containing protein [Psychrobacter sp. P11G5]